MGVSNTTTLEMKATNAEHTRAVPPIWHRVRVCEKASMQTGKRVLLCRVIQSVAVDLSILMLGLKGIPAELIRAVTPICRICDEEVNILDGYRAWPYKIYQGICAFVC